MIRIHGRRLRGRATTADAVFRHPLFVLLIGAIATSTLLPAINARATRKRVAEELRIQKSIEVLQSNGEANRRLNLVLNELEAFYKDHEAAPEPAERAELGRRVQELYRDFDASAWWWLPEKYGESILLRLLPAERDRDARQLIDEYNANLVQSTQTIDREWHALVRTAYSPDPTRRSDD